MKERRIDLDAFAKVNLIYFLKKSDYYLTATAATSLCARTVLKFYANLTNEVGDETSQRYGQVYVRDKFYQFTPSVVNTLCKIPTPADEEEEADIHEVVSFITGGLKFLLILPFSTMCSTKLMYAIGILQRTLQLSPSNKLFSFMLLGLEANLTLEKWLFPMVGVNVLFT